MSNATLSKIASRRGEGLEIYRASRVDVKGDRVECRNQLQLNLWGRLGDDSQNKLLGASKEQVPDGEKVLPHQELRSAESGRCRKQNVGNAIAGCPAHLEGMHQEGHQCGEESQFDVHPLSMRIRSALLSNVPRERSFKASE